MVKNDGYEPFQGRIGTLMTEEYFERGDGKKRSGNCDGISEIEPVKQTILDDQTPYICGRRNGFTFLESKSQPKDYGEGCPEGTSACPSSSSSINTICRPSEEMNCPITDIKLVEDSGEFASYTFAGVF